MRRSAVKWIAALGGGSAALAAGLVVGCLADPRAGEKVESVGACDVDRLPQDTVLGKTLKTYFEATIDLKKAATDADAALRDACLEIYKDPGLGITAPPNPPNASVACQPLITRMVAANKEQPVAPALNSLPAWVLIQHAVQCKTPAGTKEACLSTCADPCTVQNCEPGKLAGKCVGDCDGICTTVDTTTDGGAECNGECVGEVIIPNTRTDHEGHIFGGTCDGECEGTCNGGVFAGNCGGACSGEGPDGRPAFVGRCAETCHGTCNNNPLAERTPQPDGGYDAGTLDPTSLFADAPPALNDDPGNCGTGICRGTCSGGSDGTCFGRCIDYKYSDGGYYYGDLAPFKAGECTGSLCVGTCRSAHGTPAPHTEVAILQRGNCRGECTAKAHPTPPLPTNQACTGICRPDPATADQDGGPAFCTGGFEPGSEVCDGELKCNQNAECANACNAKAALAAVCDDPLALQIYSVTDPKLYDALKAHGAALAKASARLAKVREAFGYIGNRSYSDFVTLGDGRANDLVTKCANEGAANAAEANKVLILASPADPTR